MNALSPPIPRSSKGRRFRNFLRRMSGRRRKYVVKAPRKLRRAWKRSNKYYYPGLELMANDTIDLAKSQEEQVRRTAKRSFRVLDRLRKRLLKEFVSGKRKNGASSTLPWNFIFKTGKRGLFGLIYRSGLELAKIMGVPGMSTYHSHLGDRLDNATRSLKRIDRILRRMHLMRLLPWRRRAQRRLNVAFEW